MLCHKISILHIDDEEDFLDMAKTYLEYLNEKMSVDTVSSPRKALQILESRMYDFIVSDQCMPGMTGLELKEELQERGINIPFLLLSGTRKDEINSKASELGVVSYLRKNVDPETLFRHLSSIISEVTGHAGAETSSVLPRSPQLL
ncbi:MAG: response regulator [Candidatus Odinarchaeota archaeon]